MKNTKRTYRKRTTTKKRFVRRGGVRRVRDVPDIASCSVKRTVRSTDPDGNFRTNDMYELRNVDLASYDRAVAVAKAYQHFRIKKITLTLKPVYDTYQTGAGNATRPNLYYMIDKSGSIPDNATLETLKQMGAKAHRFDEKPFSISWRPSVLTADTTAPGVVGSAQYKISPWLSTAARPLIAPWAPSEVDHLGVFFYVEQLFGGGTQFNAEIEVQFQFKKPLFEPPSALAVAAKKVMVSPVDDSSDGIVGGPDANNLNPT